MNDQKPNEALDDIEDAFTSCAQTSMSDETWRAVRNLRNVARRRLQDALSLEHLRSYQGGHNPERFEARPPPPRKPPKPESD